VSTAFEQALAWEREMAADFYVRDTTLQDCADAPGLPTAGWSAEAKAVLAAEADEG
jgi:hypothetical protein